jgi:hypothetical protein
MGKHHDGGQATAQPASARAIVRGEILSHVNMPNVRIAFICTQSKMFLQKIFLIVVTRTARAGSAGK